MKHLPQVIFLVGPTAVGKTEVACRLARKVRGEIISCDSMQVYRQVRIASNKPSTAALKAVPHHLVDVVSVEEEFDVARFRKAAVASIRQIMARRRVPLIVGGSGLYMSVLLDGIFEGQAKDEALRRRLETVAEEKGNVFLHEELRRRDPPAAEKIHANDRRRIIRALEVFELTRTPISAIQKNRKGLWGQYDIRVFGLNYPRQELYGRIDRRVEAMFREGLLKEVEGLRRLLLSQTAAKIIGIKEVGEHLEGRTGLAVAKELMKQNTRRYAKRQLTWFRRDSRIEWIELEEKITPPEAVKMILRSLEEK